MASTSPRSASVASARRRALLRARSRARPSSPSDRSMSSLRDSHSRARRPTCPPRHGHRVHGVSSRRDPSGTVLLADRPALTISVCAAHPELIGNGRVPLVVRRVPPVESDFHGFYLIELLAIAASVPARSTRVRLAAPKHERTCAEQRRCACRCRHRFSRERHPGTAGRAPSLVVVFGP